MGAQQTKEEQNQTPKYIDYAPGVPDEKEGIKK